MSEHFFAETNRKPQDLFAFNQADMIKQNEQQQCGTGKSEIDPYSYSQGDRRTENATSRPERHPGASSESSPSPWLPDIHIDGTDRPAPLPDKPQKASIERDSQGRITEINYAGQNKIRQFIRDTEGKLTSVVTRDRNGRTTLSSDQGKWYTEVFGKKLALPGKVELAPDGTFSLPLDADTYRSEKPDGSTSIDKTNAVGARISFTKDGKIERITRRNGSIAEAEYDKGALTQIIDSTADGKQVKWNRLDAVWTSDTQPPQQRINLSLEANGNTTFSGLDGVKHTIRGDGQEIIESPGKGKFSYDSQGRIQSIGYGNENVSRSFGYDGNTNTLKEVTIADKTKDKTVIFSKGSKDCWDMTDSKGKKIGTWYGEMSLSNDGIYSVKQTVRKSELEDDPQPENVPAGTTAPESPAPSAKSSSSDNWMDPNWDGWYDSGKDNPEQPDEPTDNQTGNQTDDPPGWNDIPDPGIDNPDPALDLPDPEVDTSDPDSDNLTQDDNEDSPSSHDLSISNATHNKWISYLPDGTTANERVSADGNKAFFDERGSLESIRRVDGSAVEAVYSSNKLSRVIESNPRTAELYSWTKQQNGTWTSDSPKHRETLRDLNFTGDGDMTYTGADGAKHIVRLDGADDIEF